MSQALHLLVIAYVWPEPTSSAAGSHMLSILESFQSRGWSITLASPAQRTEHGVDLESLGIYSQDILLNDSSFDVFIETLQPGIVLFDRFMMEEQFSWRVERSCPKALRVLDTEDLFCLRHARHEQHKNRLKNTRASVADTEIITADINQEMIFTELAQREIAAIYRCDLSLIISEAEYDILTQMFKVDPSLLIYYPLQMPSPSEAERAQLPSFTDRVDFISIGNFRHPPNWDAVLWLRETLWPGIRQQLPQANLHIYGAYTPPKASALNNPALGFYIQGWAPDAKAVMKKARVNIAALRFGAGLKGKILDAMSCGTPSITTPIGAEGISGNSPFPGLVGDRADIIINQASTLYTNKETWSVAQNQALSTIEQRFSSDLYPTELMDRIEHLQGTLQAHRLNNFIGAMMRHHQHKSTKYMGQWIKEKNKPR